MKVSKKNAILHNKYVLYVIFIIALSNLLTFAYSYDFQEGDNYSQTFSLSSGLASFWGSSTWGAFNWNSTGGGLVTRRDLTGRGRVARFKFSNSNLSETFQIDGVGSYAHLETNV